MKRLKFDKKKTLSFLRLAFGFTDKPGPFAAFEVGTHCLKLVEMVTQEESETLLGYWRKELIPGEGLTDLQRQRELQDATREFLKEVTLSSKKIHLGFSGNFLFVRRLAVPEMPEAELPQALRWAARSQLPFPSEEAFLQFEILERREKKFETVIIAAQETHLTDWVKAVQDAGYRVASITSAPLALLHWLGRGELLKEEAVALVDMGGMRTSLFVTRFGKLHFIRDLETGGNAITHSLTQALATPEGELKLDYGEAEELKRKYGFPREGEVTGEKLSVSQMVGLERPVLERLASEIKRSFDYFQEEFGGSVQKVYLYGGPSRMKHLTEFLSEKIDRPVELLPFQMGFRWNPSSINEETLRAVFPWLVPALAVGIQRGRGMNFLPRRFRERKGQLVERIAVRLLGALVFLVLLLSGIFQRAQLQLLKNELRGIQPSMKLVREADTLRGNLQERQRISVEIQRGHPYLLGALKEIAENLPSHAVLERMMLYRGGHELQLSGTLFGSSEKPAEILLGELISQFEKSPFFKEVKLISTRRDEAFEESANYFEIACRLKVQ